MNSSMTAAAYTSNQPGEDRVFVQAFPEGGQVVPISVGQGTEAVWSRDGRELFYRNGDQLWVVDVETEPGFTVGSPRVLFEGRYDFERNDLGTPNYDVSRDGPPRWCSSLANRRRSRRSSGVRWVPERACGPGLLERCSHRTMSTSRSHATYTGTSTLTFKTRSSYSPTRRSWSATGRPRAC